MDKNKSKSPDTHALDLTNMFLVEAARPAPRGKKGRVGIQEDCVFKLRDGPFGPLTALELLPKDQTKRILADIEKGVVRTGLPKELLPSAALIGLSLSYQP